MIRHENPVLRVVRAPAQDGPHHGVRAPRDDRVVGGRQDRQIHPDRVRVVRVPGPDEEEVVVLVLDVVPAPLHVIGHVQKHAVVLVLPELVHGVVEEVGLERLLSVVLARVVQVVGAPVVDGHEGEVLAAGAHLAGDLGVDLVHGGGDIGLEFEGVPGGENKNVRNNPNKLLQI